VVADSPKPATTAASPVVEKSSPSITTVATPKTSATTAALNNPQPVVKLVKLSTPTTITTSCDITNNQEQIVEKAKQVIATIDYFNNLFLRYKREIFTIEYFI